MKAQLLRQFAHLVHEQFSGVQLRRPHHLPLGVHENDPWDRHVLILALEFVGVRPADDEAHKLLGGFQHRRVVQDLRERTALEAGRRSSGVRAGEADEHPLVLLLGGSQGGVELPKAGVLPGEVLVPVFDPTRAEGDRHGFLLVR